MRPSGCCLFIQNEASHRYGDHENHVDSAHFLGNAVSVIDFEEHDWRKADVGTAPTYRGYFTSYRCDEDDWDHKECHGWNESGRSFRYWCADKSGGYYVSLISVPLLDCVYPICTYVASKIEDCHTMVTINERYFTYRDVVRTIRMVAVHGRNLDKNQRPDLLSLDLNDYFYIGDEIASTYARRRKSDKNFHYVIMLCKHLEMDAFLLDPLSLIKKRRDWRLLNFEDGFTDRFGEPGYWSAFGYKSSDGVKVDHNLLHIDDRGTCVFEINVIGEPLSISEIKKRSKPLYIDTPAMTEDLYYKCERKDVRELAKYKVHSRIPLSVYRQLSTRAAIPANP